jgi:hypothetical protein
MLMSSVSSHPTSWRLLMASVVTSLTIKSNHLSRSEESTSRNSQSVVVERSVQGIQKRLFHTIHENDTRRSHLQPSLAITNRNQVLRRERHVCIALYPEQLIFAPGIASDNLVEIDAFLP